MYVVWPDNSTLRAPMRSLEQQGCHSREGTVPVFGDGDVPTARHVGPHNLGLGLMDHDFIRTSIRGVHCGVAPRMRLRSQSKP